MAQKNLKIVGLLIAGGVEVACGQVRAPEGGRDADVDGAIPDAPPDAPARACSFDGVFGPPTLLPATVNTGVEFSATLTSDQLSIIFRRGSPGDLFVATRADLAQDFGTATALSELNTSDALEGSPSITADGLTIVLVSDRPGGLGARDIYASTRSSTSTVFATPSLVANVNTTFSENGVFISPDGNSLYMAVTSAVSADEDLFVSDKVGGQFEAPRAIGELNTVNRERDPVVSADGLTIYFSRCDSGDVGLGTCQIMRAHRAATTDAFGPPVAVTELNTDGVADFPVWLSPDHCDLYILTAGGFHVTHRL